MHNKFWLLINRNETERKNIFIKFKTNKIHIIESPRVTGQAGNSPPHHLDRSAVPTTTPSKSYWKKGTLTGTPSLDRAPIRHWYPPHLHGTAWGET